MELDLDLEAMDREALIAEVVKLRTGIRKHRDAEGHNLCWFVPELWGLLPDKMDPLPRVPRVPEFLANCATYRASLDGAFIAPMTWVDGEGLIFLRKKEEPPPIEVPEELETQACSSAVERLLHTEEVGGSNPLGPTDAR